ncbi:MAG: ABC transporter permease subunit [Rhodospirillales bacterium]|nr:ABC transporter permease subunit [Rhodospirillales bacterium]
MLFTKLERRAAIGVFLLLFALTYGVPYALILAASLARSWNGVLPSGITLGHFAGILGGADGAALFASVATAAMASLAALVLGVTAALGARDLSRRGRAWADLIFFATSAVPTVSIGLALLVAFSQPPVLLNGTIAIVVLAHALIVFAYAYGGARAGLAQLPDGVEAMAESLGAGRATRLFRVTLPLLMGHLRAALALAIAMSMGELAATAMLYPPGWATLPLRIFALSDRGDVLNAAALTSVLAAMTFALLAALRK